MFDGKNAGVLGPQGASTAEVFAGVHALSQLFLRGRSRKRLQRLAGDWSQAVCDDLTGLATRLGTVELDGRRRVVETSVDLLRDWPVSFLDFANRSGISQEHFSGSEALSPPWMQSIVHESLRKQNRGVTVEHVRAMAATLSAHGHAVTKARVAAALHSEGQALIAVMALRQQATGDELLKIIDKVPRQSRRWGVHQQIAECRNRLVFLRAVIARKSLRDVTDLPLQVFWRAGEPSCHGCEREKRLRTEFSRSAREYERLIQSKTLARASAKRLYVARDGSAARRAQIWMSRAMEELDSRLSRSVRVFYSTQ